ncbi:MAG: Coenzyme A biosynthesis bifunctional protein CoaBC [Gemmatimonadaceae bacterium]|nr:Coenzyme A biosynthesis bifunctional protein CoaBC [Gemmatimonadaceae bacterium]
MRSNTVSFRDGAVEKPVRPLDRRRILLGVTGGIASYKSAWLARILTQAGAEVDVVLTRSAQEFVGAVTFEALTGRRVHTAILEPGQALEHIKLARAAELVVIAPATADFLSRAAAGRADDLLAAILLATTAPVLFVPAMNDRMWAHPQTRANVVHLRELGYRVLEPDVGELAVGEGSGPGRMPEPETVFAHIGRLLEPATGLTGKRVLVSAGPTREALDPVRFISNRSSGRMGIAIAAAAWRRGANVTLVHGPLTVRPPTGALLVGVESAQDMLREIAERLPEADVLIMAAAPADFRPAEVAGSKLKKASAPSAVPLAATPDILVETTGARKVGSIIVGFALETDEPIANARGKLARKGLDLVVLNDARESGAGFETETNRVTLLARDGTMSELPLMTKDQVADAILDRVGGLLGGH